MARTVLVDTGPIIAYLREADEHHRTCVEAFKTLPKGLPTTWPVLTEAVYILRKDPRSVGQILRFFDEGLLRLVELDARATPWMAEFFARYADREPQVADASLVYLAERDGFEAVFSLDRRDFSVYRTSDNRPLTLLPLA